MSTDEAMFSVNLRRHNAGWRWVVVCDRCSTELSVSTPVAIFKVPNLEEMMVVSPRTAEELAARLQGMWIRARDTQMPLIIDAAIDTEYLHSLEGVLIGHAEGCPRSTG